MQHSARRLSSSKLQQALASIILTQSSSEQQVQRAVLTLAAGPETPIAELPPGIDSPPMGWQTCLELLQRRKQAFVENVVGSEGTGVAAAGAAFCSRLGAQVFLKGAGWEQAIAILSEQKALSTSINALNSSLFFSTTAVSCSVRAAGANSEAQQEEEDATVMGSVLPHLAPGVIEAVIEAVCQVPPETTMEETTQRVELAQQLWSAYALPQTEEVSTDKMVKPIVRELILLAAAASSEKMPTSSSKEKTEGILADDSQTKKKKKNRSDRRLLLHAFDILVIEGPAASQSNERRWLLLHVLSNLTQTKNVDKLLQKMFGNGHNVTNEEAEQQPKPLAAEGTVRSAKSSNDADGSAYLNLVQQGKMWAFLLDQGGGGTAKKNSVKKKVHVSPFRAAKDLQAPLMLLRDITAHPAFTQLIEHLTMESHKKPLFPTSATGGGSPRSTTMSERREHIDGILRTSFALYNKRVAIIGDAFQQQVAPSHSWSAAGAKCRELILAMTAKACCASRRVSRPLRPPMDGIDQLLAEEATLLSDVLLVRLDQDLFGLAFEEQKAPTTTGHDSRKKRKTGREIVNQCHMHMIDDVCRLALRSTMPGLRSVVKTNVACHKQLDRNKKNQKLQRSGDVKNTTEALNNMLSLSLPIKCGADETHSSADAIELKTQVRFLLGLAIRFPQQFFRNVVHWCLLAPRMPTSVDVVMAEADIFAVRRALEDLLLEEKKNATSNLVPAQAETDLRQGNARAILSLLSSFLEPENLNLSLASMEFPSSSSSETSMTMRLNEFFTELLKFVHGSAMEIAFAPKVEHIWSQQQAAKAAKVERHGEKKKSRGRRGSPKKHNSTAEVATPASGSMTSTIPKVHPQSTFDIEDVHKLKVARKERLWELNAVQRFLFAKVERANRSLVLECEKTPHGINDNDQQAPPLLSSEQQLDHHRFVLSPPVKHQLLFKHKAIAVAFSPTTTNPEPSKDDALAAKFHDGCFDWVLAPEKVLLKMGKEKARVHRTEMLYHMTTTWRRLNTQQRRMSSSATSDTSRQIPRVDRFILGETGSACCAFASTHHQQLESQRDATTLARLLMQYAATGGVVEADTKTKSTTRALTSRQRERLATMLDKARPSVNTSSSSVKVQQDATGSGFTLSSPSSSCLDPKSLDGSGETMNDFLLNLALALPFESHHKATSSSSPPDRQDGILTEFCGMFVDLIVAASDASGKELLRSRIGDERFEAFLSEDKENDHLQSSPGIDARAVGVKTGPYTFGERAKHNRRQLKWQAALYNYSQAKVALAEVEKKMRADDHKLEADVVGAAKQQQQRDLQAAAKHALLGAWEASVEAEKVRRERQSQDSLLNLTGILTNNRTTGVTENGRNSTGFVETLLFNRNPDLPLYADDLSPTNRQALQLIYSAQHHNVVAPSSTSYTNKEKSTIRRGDGDSSANRVELRLDGAEVSETVMKRTIASFGKTNEFLRLGAARVLSEKFNVCCSLPSQRPPPSDEELIAAVFGKDAPYAPKAAKIEVERLKKLHRHMDAGEWENALTLMPSVLKNEPPLRIARKAMEACKTAAKKASLHQQRQGVSSTSSSSWRGAMEVVRYLTATTTTTTSGGSEGHQHQSSGTSPQSSPPPPLVQTIAPKDLLAIVGGAQLLVSQANRWEECLLLCATSTETRADSPMHQSSLKAMLWSLVENDTSSQQVDVDVVLSVWALMRARGVTVEGNTVSLMATILLRASATTQHLANEDTNWGEAGQGGPPRSKAIVFTFNPVTVMASVEGKALQQLCQDVAAGVLPLNEHYRPLLDVIFNTRVHHLSTKYSEVADAFDAMLRTLRGGVLTTMEEAQKAEEMLDDLFS